MDSERQKLISSVRERLQVLEARVASGGSGITSQQQGILPGQSARSQTGSKPASESSNHAPDAPWASVLSVRKKVSGCHE